MPVTGTNVFTIEARTTLGDVFVIVDMPDDAEPLFFARSGIIKETVEVEPVWTDQVEYVGGGRFNLITGDIFGDQELVTVLYKIS